MRRRGLKLLGGGVYDGMNMSPPVRRRGLKQNWAVGIDTREIVASRAEAWIETMNTF